MTIGGDIHALTTALLECIDAIALADDASRRLPQPIRQSLENHWNVLAAVERRYRRVHRTGGISS